MACDTMYICASVKWNLLCIFISSLQSTVERGICCCSGCSILVLSNAFKMYTLASKSVARLQKSICKNTYKFTHTTSASEQATEGYGPRESTYIYIKLNIRMKKVEKEKEKLSIFNIKLTSPISTTATVTITAVASFTIFPTRFLIQHAMRHSPTYIYISNRLHSLAG